MRPTRDVLARRHFVPHEVLKDDADLVARLQGRVFAKINSIQQDLAFRSDRKTG